MSLDPIEPIRVVPTRRVDAVVRERRHGERGGRRDPKEEQQDKRDEAVEDDGLPHIDVRA